jgi:DNA-binding NarL/FixJ family response regulator
MARGSASENGAAKPLRVVLAEDSFLVREGVTTLLEMEPSIDLVGTCGDRDALLDLVDREQPDVVVTDIRMPPDESQEGIEVADQLRRTHPSIGVVILSQYTEPRYALMLLESGSDGRAYLLKDRLNNRRALTEAIEAVAGGGSVIDPRVVDVLVSAQTQAESSPLADLTTREREILAEIATGKSNAAIAESLVLTKRAVEKHINAIFWKLNLHGAEDVSQRVKATLMYLGEEGSKRP